MHDIHTSTTVEGAEWCPNCSNPPLQYVYHPLGSICPKFFETQTPSIQINLPQPPPQENDKPIVWDLVIQDMRDRDAKGVQKYHTHLQPFNGRDALIDAYQEALDLVVYLRQLIYEKYKE